MKLIHGLLFVFFLISPFANLHNLNASEPGPLEAAGGAGSMPPEPTPELTYEIVKNTLDTNNIFQWNFFLRTYGIKKIQDTWRAENYRLSMLDYCWKNEKAKAGKKHTEPRRLSNLILQAMTSNEFIKDAIHTQNLAALKDAIGNIFGDSYSENKFNTMFSDTISKKETEEGFVLTDAEYKTEHKKALESFHKRMPSYREYEEALMRWSIEYPSILPQEYILETYDESVLDSSMNPKIRGIFNFFNAYSESNEKFEEIAANRLGIIYKNIKTAIDLQNLELLQIDRKNYDPSTIIEAWVKNDPDGRTPEEYAMDKGITNELLLSELGLYTDALTELDVCASPPADDENDETEEDCTPLKKQRSRTERPPAPPLP